MGSSMGSLLHVIRIGISVVTSNFTLPSGLSSPSMRPGRHTLMRLLLAKIALSLIQVLIPNVIETFP